MGLLDDAIREHLELKRLRGADPGTVAREEREAFGAARGGEPAEHDDGNDWQSSQADLADEEDEPREEASAWAEDSNPGAALTDDGAEEGGGGFPNVGQETLELDMRTVLYDQGPEEEAPGDEPHDGAGQPADTAQPADTD